MSPTDEHRRRAREWLSVRGAMKDAEAELAEEALLAQLLADAEERIIEKAIEECREVFCEHIHTLGGPKPHRGDPRARAAVGKCMQRLEALIGREPSTDDDD